MRMHFRAAVGKIALTAVAGALLAACGATPGQQAPAGTQAPYSQLAPAPTGNPEATKAANGGRLEVTTVPTNAINSLATASAPTAAPTTSTPATTQ